MLLFFCFFYASFVYSHRRLEFNQYQVYHDYLQRLYLWKATVESIKTAGAATAAITKSSILKSNYINEKLISPCRSPNVEMVPADFMNPIDLEICISPSLYEHSLS